MKTGRGTRWENTQTFDFNSVIPDVHFRFSRIRFWLVLLAFHLITFTLFCNWNCIFCNCQVLNCSFDLGVEFPIERMLIQTDLSTMVGTWINPELHKPYWLQIVGYEFSAAGHKFVIFVSQHREMPCTPSHWSVLDVTLQCPHSPGRPLSEAGCAW